jgi:hypothetical protein
MANLSDLSVKLCEEYLREHDLVEKRLFLSSFCKTKQGVVEIKEWQPPSTIDALKEMQSSGNLSDALSVFVNFRLKVFIDKEDSSDSIPVNLESVIKPTNDIINPCKVLPNCDVVGQETTRLSLAEIVDPKSPSKRIKNTSSALSLGGQQNKGEATGCTEAGLTGGATRSNRLSQAFA